MPNVDSFVPGTFCWTELTTTDAAGAKRFYSELFGWSINDMEFAPGQVYTMLQLAGRDAAALSQMQPQQQQQGIPSHWLSYVSVTSAAETAAKAKELGGTVLAGPFDVLDVGVMAVIQDPTGATFAAWEPRNHKGAGIVHEPGSMTWFELTTKNTDAARAFYTRLFGWEAKSSAFGEMTYTEFFTQGQAVGGMIQMAPEWGNAPSHWAVYFAVADVDASAQKAQQLGAKTFVPPMDIPNVGRFALLADPQGATFAIFKMGNHQKA